MPEFMIGLNHNLSMGGLAPFVPYQPLTRGWEWTEETPTAGGIVVQGPFIRFTWGQISEAQNIAMITQAGLLLVRRRAVTIYAQDENYTWGLFNGTANKPRNQYRKGYWFNNVPLVISDLFPVTP